MDRTILIVLALSSLGCARGDWTTVFSWQLTGPFLRFPYVDPPIKRYRGEATITVDEMSGRADGFNCPCTFILRRVNTDAIKEKKAQ